MVRGNAPNARAPRAPGLHDRARIGFTSKGSCKSGATDGIGSSKQASDTAVASTASPEAAAQRKQQRSSAHRRAIESDDWESLFTIEREPSEDGDVEHRPSLIERRTVSAAAPDAAPSTVGLAPTAAASPIAHASSQVQEQGGVQELPKTGTPTMADDMPGGSASAPPPACEASLAPPPPPPKSPLPPATALPAQAVTVPAAVAPAAPAALEPPVPGPVARAPAEAVLPVSDPWQAPNETPASASEGPHLRLVTPEEQVVLPPPDLSKPSLDAIVCASDDDGSDVPKEEHQEQEMVQNILPMQRRASLESTLDAALLASVSQPTAPFVSHAEPSFAPQPFVSHDRSLSPPPREPVAPDRAPPPSNPQPKRTSTVFVSHADGPLVGEPFVSHDRSISPVCTREPLASSAQSKPTPATGASPDAAAPPSSPVHPEASAFRFSTPQSLANTTTTPPDRSPTVDASCQTPPFSTSSFMVEGMPLPPIAPLSKFIPAIPVLELPPPGESVEVVIPQVLRGPPSAASTGRRSAPTSVTSSEHAQVAPLPSSRPGTQPPKRIPPVSSPRTPATATKKPTAAPKIDANSPLAGLGGMMSPRAAAEAVANLGAAQSEARPPAEPLPVQLAVTVRRIWDVDTRSRSFSVALTCFTYHEAHEKDGISAQQKGKGLQLVNGDRAWKSKRFNPILTCSNARGQTWGEGNSCSRRRRDHEDAACFWESVN